MTAHHGWLFWTHFASAIGGVAVYGAAVLVFLRFARISLYRPTCIALCWVFGALALLLAAHTAAKLIDGLEPILQIIDIGVRVVVGFAVAGCYLDTRRHPFASILTPPESETRS